MENTDYPFAYSVIVSKAECADESVFAGGTDSPTAMNLVTHMLIYTVRQSFPNSGVRPPKGAKDESARESRETIVDLGQSFEKNLHILLKGSALKTDYNEIIY
ncbi:hypothetical protein TNCV_1541591 [Trichonephila clavipes]|nr:hypothetical protein TNCV_1541591 [Trichonephila clavipes]